MDAFTHKSQQKHLIQKSQRWKELAVYEDKLSESHHKWETDWTTMILVETQCQ